MHVRVLFFGAARDATGFAEESIELAAGSTVAALLDQYAQRFPALDGMRSSLALAVNRNFRERSSILQDNDEVAFLPPVSGGAGNWTQQIEEPAGHFFALTHETIDAAPLRERMLRGEDGAVVVFEGVTRNNTKGRRTLRLEYECYEPMAIEMMARIGRELATALPIGRIAMLHRLGRLEVGETSVVVIATAPHRKAAFDAASEGIQRLKRLVPIWKKEYFEDGEVWVEGEWDASVTSL